MVRIRRRTLGDRYDAARIAELRRDQTPQTRTAFHALAGDRLDIERALYEARGNWSKLTPDQLRYVQQRQREINSEPEENENGDVLCPVCDMWVAPEEVCKSEADAKGGKHSKRPGRSACLNYSAASAIKSFDDDGEEGA